VVMKENDSSTSWFFEGPQMETLALAVETVARKALIHLRDITTTKLSKHDTSIRVPSTKLCAMHESQMV
jgi:hypothetical protein